MAVKHRLEPVETLILGQLRRGRPDRFQACLKSSASPEHSSKYSEEQIIGFLKQAEAGMPIKELCREGGFPDAIFYTWRAAWTSPTPGGSRNWKPPSIRLTFQLDFLPNDRYGYGGQVTSWQSGFLGHGMRSDQRRARKKSRSSVLHSVASTPPWTWTWWLRPLLLKALSRPPAAPTLGSVAP